MPTTPATTGPEWQPKKEVEIISKLIKKSNLFLCDYLPTLIFMGILFVGFIRVAILSNISKAISTIWIACLSVSPVEFDSHGRPLTTI